MKKKLLILLILATLCSLFAGPVQRASAATAPALKKKSVSIEIGRKRTLKLKDNIKGATIKWTSGNNYVATVSKKGVVKGVNKGETKIYCRVSVKKEDYFLECKVTVVTPKNSYKARYETEVYNTDRIYRERFSDVSPVQQFLYMDQGLAYAYKW